MIKLKDILNEQRPMPMDTPNEFWYMDFKKYAYKKRGMIKKEMLKHKGDSSKMFKTLSAIWYKWARIHAKHATHIKDPIKFGRALMVMMVKDNLIFDKAAWKKNNKITHIKEQLALAGGIINGAPDPDDVEKVKNTLTTDRDYVYNTVHEQNTAKIDQALRKAETLPIVDRIKMINQIRQMLGERQMESIQGYHTLMEDDDGIGKINGHSISLEIEETPEGLQRGLMHRKEFPSGKGMLLKFGKNEPTNIWMKNVNFPLDIIYIQDNKVVDMFKNAKPDSGDGLFDYLSGVVCDMVLELPAGDADKYEIGLGDMFGFNDLRKDRVTEQTRTETPGVIDKFTNFVKDKYNQYQNYKKEGIDAGQFFQGIDLNPLVPGKTMSFEGYRAFPGKDGITSVEIRDADGNVNKIRTALANNYLSGGITKKASGYLDKLSDRYKNSIFNPDFEWDIPKGDPDAENFYDRPFSQVISNLFEDSNQKNINEVEPALSLYNVPDAVNTKNQYASNIPKSTSTVPDKSNLQYFADDISSASDFLTQKHDIYNKGGLNIKGQVNAPEVSAGWNTQGGMTPWGSPTADLDYSGNITADYKVNPNVNLYGGANVSTKDWDPSSVTGQPFYAGVKIRL